MILTIAAKELRSMFASPLAWVVLAFLQLVLAWIFLARLDYFMNIQAQLSRLPNPPGLTDIVVAPVFGVASFVLLMSVPLLTMRLIAEERRNQTMTLLMSAPLSMTEIVLGKFFATLGFLFLVLLLILAMSLSLLAGGKLDLGMVAANAVGLLLLSATFAAIGLFVSCLTGHPVVAAVLSLAVFLGLWIINIAASDPDSPLHLVSLLRHFERFTNGTVALTDLIYFALLIAMFLALSIRRLDADRMQA
ncbi:MAG TPA: ABC transporter permease subunit [Burkholderiales bacterium]|jgi:ABC-2 type transport system permease protein|nr:ABC transporter permease subunit [Burkholderiales bacterium]